MAQKLVVTLLLAMLAMSTQVGAHTGSNSFIYWTSGAEHGRLDIAAADAAPWISSSSSLTWQDVVSASDALQQRVADGVTISASDGSSCPMAVSLAGMTRYGSATYLSFALDAGCPSPAVLSYSLMFEDNPLHRALVTVTDEAPSLMVLSPGQETLSLEQSARSWHTLVRFGWQGMVHLWLGYDHILFLLTLMLAVLAGGRSSGKQHVISIVAVVTAFTAAHSITLILAATGTVRLPLSLVEVVIALSITLAAIQVRWPVLSFRPWLLAFAFGLIHGFGFASVLADLVPDDRLPWLPLLGFNLGLEIAQLLVVLLVMPLFFFVMRYPAWHRLGQPIAILAIAGTGLWWALERMPAGSWV